MSNGPAAQPSLPHDELETQLRQIFKDCCHTMSGTPMANMAGWGFGVQISKVEALILAQRQEAAKAELIKMRDEWGYANTVDSWEDYIEKRLAALQTYLEERWQMGPYKSDDTPGIKTKKSLFQQM